MKTIFTLIFVFSACISGYADLYINEVNSTGKWIEIYNSGENEVDMKGYYIVRNNNDGAANTAVIPPGIIIASKGFLVLYQGSDASSPVEGAIDCLPYGISSDKFMNAILKDNRGNVIDDSFDIGDPQTVTVNGGKSWARETDGAAAIAALEPTPGKSNVALLLPSELKIYVNEVNSTGKWIEFYNDEEDAVDMGRFTIIRNNNNGVVRIAVLPAGTTIASKGFLVIYQGSAAFSPVEGAVDCLTYGISSERFMNVILKDDQGCVVDDSFDIGNPQTVSVSRGKSWARETDGAAAIAALEPTPGKSNAAILLPSELKIYVNEVNAAGKWIEFYNDEEKEVNMGRYTVTRNNNDDGVSIAAIPPGTILTPKGFLVIYQGGAVFSPVEGAVDCLTYGISSDKFMDVILKDDQGCIVDDSFDIGNPQKVTVSDDKSWARETDGAATITALDPTPGSRNNIPTKLFENLKSKNTLASVYAGTLRLPEKTSHIQLYDVSGNLVLSRIVTAISIDLNDLPKGFYVAKMIISNKIFTQKIVL